MIVNDSLQEGEEFHWERVEVIATVCSRDTVSGLPPRGVRLTPDDHSSVIRFTFEFANRVRTFQEQPSGQVMGTTLSFLPFREPTWFLHYRDPEGSDGLDMAPGPCLPEGGISPIPIRRDCPSDIVVAVGLSSPPFTEEDGFIIVHYATSAPGKLTYQAGEETETVNFEENLDLTFRFLRREDQQVTLKFEFDVDTGVSARIFTLSVKGKSLPTIVDDQLVAGGVESSISRVFLRHESGSAPSDGDFTEGLCLICCSVPATVIACPCRHCCMCRACSERCAGISNHCPVCRGTVLELIDCGVESG
jgi:hypothetical protein